MVSSTPITYTKEREDMHGVHKIQIPTPFNIGPVNCYAFVEDGLTLLDPGPATEAAYSELAAGLNTNGFNVEDVDQILITHPHMDHFGLASRIVKESGARTVAHHNATVRLSDPTYHLKREQAVFEPTLLQMGVPEQIAKRAIKLPEAYTDFQPPLEIDNELTEGDTVDAGTELTVLQTPGHAPGSVCFIAQSNNVAFTGDHVLQYISPNPLLTIIPGTEAKRTRSLPTYLASLNRLQEVDVGVGYAGHGERISDLNNRISDIVDHHHSRKERIAELVTKMCPVTPYDIMQKMFPDLPAKEVFAGMSEVIGHLDLLEDEGRVEIAEIEDIKYYRVP